MTDAITLTINGTVYAGWTEARITRGLKQGASDFDFTVSEAWAGVGSAPQPWKIQPGNSVTIKIGDDLVLTGYVDQYDPSYSKDEHSVRVAGRSKTQDVIDCMPDIPGGQFRGYTLDKIARALAEPFGISVVVDCDMGDPFPSADIEKTETGFAFLEKLARQRSVLITDDENGNLVLTQAGNGGSAGALIEGSNILSANAHLAVEKRFQTYVVLAQKPLVWDDDDDADPGVIGQATDAGVQRPRRFAELAEDPMNTVEATARAEWRKRHNFGEGTLATITTQGFRQAGGTDLWKPNELIPVTSPMLAIQRQLCAGKVSWMLDSSSGSRTELELAPQDAYTPEPESAHAGDSDPFWNGGQ